MAPSRTARKSLPIPPRLTLELISDIFQVMLENMGMTESCIVDHMTSSKCFQSSHILQLRQALKLAVDMGLVTFRDSRYMFTMANLEHMIAHKQERKAQDVNASPGPSPPGPEPSADRRSLASVADYVASSSHHHEALAASLGVVRRTKRSTSHCPTPLAKRARHDAVPTQRACRTNYKPYRTESGPLLPRSSTASVRSNVSSGADTHRSIRNPRPTKKPETRKYARKCIAQKRCKDKARPGPGRPPCKRHIDQPKRGRPLKKKLNTSYNRGRKSGKPEGAEPSFNFDDPMPSTSWGRGGVGGGASKQPKLSLAKNQEKKNASKSSVSDDDSEYYVPNAKRRKSAASVTSKHSLASTSTAKTGTSHNTGSSVDSKKSKAASKAPSRTSRKSDEEADKERGARDRRSATSSLLKEYLESSFIEQTRAVQDSGSSTGSKGSGGLSKVSSKTSLNSVATPPGRVEKTRRGRKPKATTVAALRKSFAAALLVPKDSGSSVASRSSSKASKISAKTTNTDETPESGGLRNVGKKRKQENMMGACLDARTLKTRRTGSSVASKSSNASKASSKTSFNTDDTTESVRNTRGKKPETNTSTTRKTPRKSANPKTSATSTATKSSNVSKTSSRSSCNTDVSAESAQSTKKTEPTPTNQKSSIKPQNSDSSIGSKTSNVTKVSSKTSCNTNKTSASVRSTRNKEPEANTASQKPLANSSEAQTPESRKSRAASKATSKSSCKSAKSSAGDNLPVLPKTRNARKSESAGAHTSTSSSSTGAATSTSFARSVRLQPTRASPRSSCEKVDAVGEAGPATAKGRRAPATTTRLRGAATPNKDDDGEEGPDSRTMHDFYT